MKTILVIDDDLGLQDAFNFILGPPEYDVTILNNGSSIMGNEPPLADLYILDKQLSGVDGLDLCRILKANERTRNKPVIIFSASPDIVHIALAAGANAVLAKPFERETLRQLVATLLATSQ